MLFGKMEEYVLKKIFLMFMVICVALSMVGCATGDSSGANGAGESMEGSETTAATESTEHADVKEFLSSGTFLYPGKDDNFRYDLYDKFVVITLYIGSDSEVHIPSTIKGLPVVKINDKTFQDNTFVSKVVIPDGVFIIGPYAFYGCTNLCEINIPPSMLLIDESAFSGCTSLCEIDIPLSVLTIGNYAFENCTSLKELYLTASIVDVPQGLCYGCTNLVAFVWEDVESTAETVASKSIQSLAFSECPNLSVLWVPDEVVSISDNSFSDVSTYLVIYGYQSSAAAYLASEKYVDFVVLDPSEIQGVVEDALEEAATRETVPEETGDVDIQD